MNTINPKERDSALLDPKGSNRSLAKWLRHCGRKAFGAFAAILLLASPAALEAAEVYRWNFTQGTADLLNGVEAVLGDPAGLGIDGYSFSDGDGITVAQPSALAVQGRYTIILVFSLESNSSGYRRLVDFADKSEDYGMYVYDDYFYFYDTGPETDNFTFQPDERIVLVLRRTAGGRFSATFNGRHLWSFSESEGHAIFNGPDNVMRFFEDDGSEHPTGTVSKIRVFDHVLPDEATLKRQLTKQKKALRKAKSAGNRGKVRRILKQIRQIGTQLRLLRNP